MLKPGEAFYINEKPESANPVFAAGREAHSQNPKPSGRAGVIDRSPKSRRPTSCLGGDAKTSKEYLPKRGGGSVLVMLFPSATGRSPRNTSVRIAV